MGCAVLAIGYMIQAIRVRRAANSEELIEKLYREEHDERNEYIRIKAGFPVMTIGAFILVCAGAILAFYDIQVSLAVMLSGFFTLVFQLLAKLYYRKKY